MDFTSFFLIVYTGSPPKIKPLRLPNGYKIDSYDAITILKMHVFIFKFQYVWRISENGIDDGYPKETIKLWNKLPENLERIDAVYVNQKNIVFFIGRNFYSFFDQNLQTKGTLASLGLPNNLQKIDAVFIKKKTDETFIFSGSRFWMCVTYQ